VAGAKGGECFCVSHVLGSFGWRWWLVGVSFLSIDR
jgi:hypothetical protein